MMLDFEVGDFVRHPVRPDWGDGQVQSIIGQVVTVTFEEAGKQVIHTEHIALDLSQRRQNRPKIDKEHGCFWSQWAT